MHNPAIRQTKTIYNLDLDEHFVKHPEVDGQTVTTK